MFPLQERFNESRIVWSILGSYRDTPCVSSWIPVLGGKIHIFLSGSPNVVWPSNCLKIHPIAVFFLLTGLALLPPLGFLRQGGGLQLLPGGPFEVQGALDQVTTVWNRALSDTHPEPASSWAGPL